MNFVVWNTIPLLLIAISSTSINGFTSLPNNRSPLQSSSFSSVDDVGNTKWMQSIRSSSTARTLPTTTRSNRRTIHINLSLRNNNENDNDSPSPRSVNPSIRKALVGLSSLGTIETATLTYLNLFQSDGIANLCGATSSPSSSSSSSCASVLDSSYASITVNEDLSIPLTAIGCIAYATVAFLSLRPLLLTPEVETDDDDDDDTRIRMMAIDEEEDRTNRIGILFTTTTMATFSLYLLSLLYFVIHQSCQFCLLSAGISISMASIAWFGGLLPDLDGNSTTTTTNRLGLKVSAGSIGAATAAALLLFINGGGSFDIPQAQAATTTPGGEPSFVVAKATPDPKVAPTNVPPPPITATSTPQAITIAKTLQSLDAKMYGAYWCSHCNEQKQRLGREAMSYVTYVECAKDGKDSQAAMCKEAKVPGFPTWDIGGKLYPGEWGLDELEDILKEVNGRIAKGKM